MASEPLCAFDPDLVVDDACGVALIIGDMWKQVGQRMRPP